MPIYEYACHACGLEKEHLQKMNDAPITQCPACGSSDYVKKVSAAAFQLKGTGWYVTDFRNRNTRSDSKPKEESGKETTSTDKTAANTPTDSATTATAATTSTSAAAPSASTTDQ
ncbi:zinc ribbon domain-containing protein [Nitrosomonas sp. HPC101]|uniref:FmdB family zinc ribbon protein n=1 Tax=Nitrosomonas sp. HPC101 TaxID=1658667 RepID=UPI00136951AA|nr:zinc ribbon domain-containing protein [Nitrosomonas sp. HPC101]MXS85030.1 zinc ribbon domain-containing protein [Nitrosomonas sp. HPC101]